jgi:signal transduction histidine kinase
MDNMENIYNNIIKEYNNAYNSYLSEIEPRIFLHILLQNVIYIINSNCGIMLNYNNDKISIITNSHNSHKHNITQKSEINNKWYTFSKFITENNILHDESLIYHSIKNKLLIAKNNLTLKKLVGYDIKNNYKIDSILIAPFIINNIVKGVIILCNDKKYSDNIINVISKFCNMMGVLLNNIYCMPLHIKSNINNSMTYKIALDALNVVNDNIVITDRDMKIIYNNNNFNIILKSYFNIKNTSEYLYDMIPQTISFVSSGNDNNFYHNKKLQIVANNNIFNIYINSITYCNSIYHIIKITDEKKDSINTHTNSKNLIAYLSHELRNPIQAISTGIYIIDRLVKNISDSNDITNSIYSNDSNDSNDSNKSNDDINNNLNDKINLEKKDLLTLRSVSKRVKSSCKNMNIIIDDVIDLSKIDNDELIMNLDEHDLKEITDSIYEEIKDEIKKKKLKIKYEFDKTCPKFLYTDDTRIFQIITNLISNSVKYSKTGTIKFVVNYSNRNNCIYFKISDEGKGIRKEELCNLFKEYGRTSNSTHDINSTGLGLCVCQKIANLLGGSIEVCSEYRKGSTFTFIHPVKLGYNIIQ